MPEALRAVGAPVRPAAGRADEPRGDVLEDCTGSTAKSRIKRQQQHAGASMGRGRCLKREKHETERGGNMSKRRELTEREKEALHEYQDRAILNFFYDRVDQKGKAYILDIARIIYEAYADEKQSKGNIIDYPRK